MLYAWTFDSRLTLLRGCVRRWSEAASTCVCLVRCGLQQPKTQVESCTVIYSYSRLISHAGLFSHKYLDLNSEVVQPGLRGEHPVKVLNSRLMKEIFEPKVKVKCTLVQALSFCTGRTAHSGSRGIALLFHDNGTRRG